MIPTNIKLDIDSQAIKDYIQQKIDEQIHITVLLVDVKEIARLTSFSLRFLESEILCDPRMKAIEKKKNRKRWYFRKEAINVITEIVNEW